MLASEIMDRARRLIQDETSARWPLPELCRWLDDAQREIVLQKPGASSANRVLALQAGTWQKLPADALMLLRIVRNITAVVGDVRTGGSAIRVIARDVLDAQHRDWHFTEGVAFSPTVKHYIYDEEDQHSFYVYPGNTGSGKIEAVLSVEPAPIVIGASDPNELTSYAVVLALPAIYANALTDYVCYRAYSKDAQYAGNSARAAAHYTQFANSLGIKLNQEAMHSPNQSAGVRSTPTGAP